MNKYNPNTLYVDKKVIRQPGSLPPGTHIQWPDGERGTVVRSINLSTRHLIRRSAEGGGECEDSFDLAKINGLKTDAKPAA